MYCSSYRYNYCIIHVNYQSTQVYLGCFVSFPSVIHLPPNPEIGEKRGNWLSHAQQPKQRLHSFLCLPPEGRDWIGVDVFLLLFFGTPVCGIYQVLMYSKICETSIWNTFFLCSPLQIPSSKFWDLSLHLGDWQPLREGNNAFCGEIPSSPSSLPLTSHFPSDPLSSCAMYCFLAVLKHQRPVLIPLPLLLRFPARNWFLPPRKSRREGGRKRLVRMRKGLKNSLSSFHHKAFSYV